MVKKRKVKTSIIITGMICITVLEAYALYKGINGKFLATVLAILAGLAGWVLPQPKNV